MNILSKVSWRRISTLLLTPFFILAVVVATTPRASATDPQIVTIGMPFDGLWAYNVPAAQPWNDDVGDSHPAAHVREGSVADWMTDLYEPTNADATDVGIYFSGPAGTKIKAAGTWSSTCSGAGSGLKLDIYIDTAKIGQISYAHLTNIDSNGSHSNNDGYYDNGSYIGKVVTGSSSCYGGDHTHVEFDNQTNYSCYIDKGQPGASTFSAGTAIGKIGETGASGAKGACPATGTPTGTPSAVARGASAMSVFYRTTDNKIIGRGWDANGGWGASGELATDAAGNPVAITRGDRMEVFYRNTAGGLNNLGWDPATGWHGPFNVTGITGGVSGDPEAISFNQDNIELFMRTTNNELKSYSWHSSVGWYGLNTRISSGVDSGPSAVIRDANNVDIFYRRSNGNLGKLSWNLAGPWTTNEFAADMAAGAKPDVISRTDGNLDVFYRKNNGNIADRSWYWVTGWNLADWTSQLTGNPAAVNRSANSMDVVYHESGSPGSIKNLRWDSAAGWTSNQLTFDAASDPAFIKRSADNMDVFYLDGNSKLKAITWSSQTGWGSPVEPQ